MVRMQRLRSQAIQRVAMLAWIVLILSPAFSPLAAQTTGLAPPSMLIAVPVVNAA